MQTFWLLCAVRDQLSGKLDIGRIWEAFVLLGYVHEGWIPLLLKRDRARLKLILRGQRYGFDTHEVWYLLWLFETRGEHG